jgi:hypothetical protein
LSQSKRQFPLTFLPSPFLQIVTFSPKEPENPAGREARHTYLVFARGVIGETSVDYSTLYQRFAPNDWAAIKLDDGVALAALKSGYAAKDVVGFLHQSPYVQHQIHVGQVPVTTMTQYAKSTVQKALQVLGQTQGIQNLPGTGVVPQRQPDDRQPDQER